MVAYVFVPDNNWDHMKIVEGDYMPRKGEEVEVVFEKGDQETYVVTRIHHFVSCLEGDKASATVFGESKS